MLTQLFNSSLLETIIGLILVFALLSLLVSSLAEVINSYFNERGVQLYRNISRLFNDNININFGQLLYSHPMITNLRKDVNSLPQYISDTMFSQVLIEVVGNTAREYAYNDNKQRIALVETAGDPFMRFQQGVANMHHTSLKLMLQQMVEIAVATSDKPFEQLSKLETQIQQWYNDQMDRASGWFKTLMGKRLRWVALVVALTLNVDSITVFITIYKNPLLRNQLNAVAEKVADNYAQTKQDTTLTALQQAAKAVDLSKLVRDSTDTTALRTALVKLKLADSIAGIITKQQDSARAAGIERAQTQLDYINGLGLPIGWHSDITPLNIKLHKPGGGLGIGSFISNILLYLLGIAITTFSISTGAPFWFDLLLKFVNVRRAGKKPAQKT